ncbi:putative SKP1-like protein 21-like isoform X1 [Capsicum annuum]|nr:putative SKP1-like protein 21-like isoform X1 [Capsicum annuum]
MLYLILSIEPTSTVTSVIYAQVKAWVAYKHAEALRCQKLLFEEEEAAQKRQAELLERKKVKKLRQKEQKAREQSSEEKRNLEVLADCFEIPLAEVHSLPGPSDSYLNNPDVPLDPSTFSSNEDMSVESQRDLSHHHLDSVKVQNVEPQPVSANNRRLSANAEWQAPKSQRFGQNGNNQNHQAKVEPLQKHKDSGTPVNSSKIWTRKVRVGSDDASILEVRKEAIDQKQRNSEVMIGSISIPVKDCSTDQQGNCPAEARDDFGITEHAMPRKCNIVEKLAKRNAFQIGASRAAAKLWRPVRHEVGRQDPEEGVMSLKFDDWTSSPLQSFALGSSGSRKNCQVPDGNAHQDLGCSSIAAKTFLSQRWREAIAGDHVTLVISPDTELSGRPDVPNTSSKTVPASDSGEQCVVSRADNQLAKDGVLNSSSSRNNKDKFRPKPTKGIKTKYIPKQKNPSFKK